jgi:hypothetical protein
MSLMVLQAVQGYLPYLRGIIACLDADELLLRGDPGGSLLATHSTITLIGSLPLAPVSDPLLDGHADSAPAVHPLGAHLCAHDVYPRALQLCPRHPRLAAIARVERVGSKLEHAPV